MPSAAIHDSTSVLRANGRALVTGLVAFGVFAGAAAAQGSSHADVFFRAYYLHQEERKPLEALKLYRRYLELVPKGVHAAKATALMRQILGDVEPVKDLAAIDARLRHDVSTSRPAAASPTTGVLPPPTLGGPRRVSVPKMTRIRWERLRRSLDRGARVALDRGFFLQAARLRTQHAYHIVMDQLRYWLAQDDVELRGLRASRDMNRRFKNERRARRIDGQLAELERIHDRRVLVTEVGPKIREQETWVGDRTFALFLVDLESEIPPHWMRDLNDAREWLAKMAALSTSSRREVEVAKQLNDDIRRLLELVRTRRFARAQRIADRIWAWAIQSE